jgi:coproporphyrinogen III oxidase-like Fe-S oxidoreductase
MEREDILINQLLNPDALAQFQTDELFVKGNRSIKVTIKGRQFKRNICMLFDAKLVASKKVKCFLAKHCSSLINKD